MEGGAADAPPAAGRHVLVVDNDPAICAMLRACLEDAGLRVSCAASRAAAESILACGSVDVAVMDIVLPDSQDAEDLVALVRRFRAPCILMTGDPQAMSRVSRAPLPPRLLSKPFRLADLLRSIGLTASEAQ